MTDQLKGVTNKDVRKALRNAERQGCQITRTKGGHMKVTLPDGSPYFIGTTQPAARTVKNMRAHLARHGIAA